MVKVIITWQLFGMFGQLGIVIQFTPLLSVKYVPGHSVSCISVTPTSKNSRKNSNSMPIWDLFVQFFGPLLFHLIMHSQ